MDRDRILAMTTDIVSSHASANEMTQEALLVEIDQVFAKLASLVGAEDVSEILGEGPATPDALKPAVPVDAAFGADKVFCMVCGRGMKTLKRHISKAHGMKPGQYRKQFGVPAGTPLVAKNYSEARKTMAKGMNLNARLEKARAVRMARRAEAEKAQKAPKRAKKK